MTRIAPEVPIFRIRMRNVASRICIALAMLCFLSSAHQMYLSRTDWSVVMTSYGFMVLFALFALMFGYLNDLEKKFDHLTKVLSDTFVKLAAIERSRDKMGFGSNITFSFQNSMEPAIDTMSLEDLENERRKAEKNEDYERAALIQKKIDQRRRF